VPVYIEFTLPYKIMHAKAEYIKAILHVVFAALIALVTPDNNSLR